MKKYIGDKIDRELFGDLLKFVGGILLSYVILDFLKEITSDLNWLANPIVLGGFGFLIYNLGVCVRNDRDETIIAIKNTLWVLGMIIFLLLIIILNSN